MALGSEPTAELVLEYARAGRALFPRGLAWSDAIGSNLRNLLDGEGRAWARIDGRIADLQAEADPATTTELVEDWERLLGLPDPCPIISTTLQLRRAAILAKLTSDRGLSVGAFIDLAESLGWLAVDITIIEEKAFRTGVSTTGEVLQGEDWAHVWRVVAPVVNPIFAAAGLSAAGDALVAYDNDVLDCFIQNSKPAHTLALVEFTGLYTGYAPWTHLTPNGADLALATPTPTLT